MATPGSKKKSPAQQRYTGEKRWQSNKEASIERHRKFKAKRAAKRAHRIEQGKPVRTIGAFVGKKSGKKGGAKSAGSSGSE